MMKISVVIPTYNRAEYLRKAIKSLINQTLPKDQYEILVIDNRSADNTREVACEEFKHVKNLRYIYEPILGLSYARNTGWKNAKGEYVAYLDDDAIAASNWLEKILEVFETVKPKLGCVCGKIDPIWEAPRPSWLSDKKLSVLVILDWSDKPMILNRDQYLAGANLALSKDVLGRLGGFKPGFDRVGRKLLTGGDILLQRELDRSGYPCLYHPKILVRHHIPPSRLTKHWFIKRAFWQGVSDASIQIYEESPSVLWRIWKGTAILLRIFISLKELSMLLILPSDPDRFTLKCSVIARIGSTLALWGIVK